MNEASLVEHLLHELVRKLDTEAKEKKRISVGKPSNQKAESLQSSRVGRHSTSQRRAETREESLETTAGVHGADSTANSGLARCALQAGLDSVDGENGNPHGNTGGTTRSNNRRQGQLASHVAIGILGGQRPLDVLVGGKVGGRSGTITSQRHGAAAEDTTDTALLVQLAHDIHTTGVLGLLAGRGRVLALDLEQDLDALEGGGDQGHGNGGEETSGGDLGYGVLRGAVDNWHV